MAGSHNEKALARIEALMGQEEEPRAIVFIGRDLQPLPGQEPMWYGGSERSRAAALAKWKKAEAARIRKAKARIAEIDAQLARARRPT